MSPSCRRSNLPQTAEAFEQASILLHFGKSGERVALTWHARSYFQDLEDAVSRSRTPSDVRATASYSRAMVCDSQISRVAAEIEPGHCGRY